MWRKISVLRGRTGEAEWAIIDIKIRARKKGGRLVSSKAPPVLIKVVIPLSGARVRREP